MALTEINTANQAELEMVIGVGPDLSAHILTQRQQEPFRDWPDAIARLKGIGPVRAERLSAEGLRVNGVPFTRNRAQSPKASAPQASAP